MDLPVKWKKKSLQATVNFPLVMIKSLTKKHQSQEDGRHKAGLRAILPNGCLPPPNQAASKVPAATTGTSLCMWLFTYLYGKMQHHNMTFTYIGCTAYELYEHIVSKCLETMTKYLSHITIGQ